MGIKLKQSGIRQVKDCMMFNLLLKDNLKSQKYVIAESQVINKEMTSIDKLNICESDTHTMKSLKISEAESTSKEKALIPYWNESCKEMSMKLLSLTKTDCVDLDLNSSVELQNITTQKSWFSTKHHSHLRKNLCKIYFPSSMFSHVEFTDSEAMVRRSRKIRVYPQNKQKLNSWFGVSRFFYNKTIALLKDSTIQANRFDIQKDILNDCPQWAKDIPYKIKQMAIEDACQAVKNAKFKYKQTGIFNTVKFRKKKNRHDCFYVPKQAISESGIFKTKMEKFIISEQIGEITYDCRLLFDKGRYFLIVPESRAIKQPENQRLKIVALDPGVRTFITYFAPQVQGKIGEHDFGRIYRLCYHIDNLVSKMVKAKCKQKRNIRKAYHRMLYKIKDLIHELHCKTAGFLCKTFNTIILPAFETSDMVTKLKSKVARAMLGWSHYKFQQFLKYKAEEYSCNVIIQNEAYTSKTCSYCGNIQNVGSKEYWKCNKCNLSHDRDINGARGIFLRALGDSPCGLETNYCNC